ncbi:MAG TPA: hypothetical protein GXZ36_09295 [Firmicutes bacterium]|nr:hypothetical protein [Bacillota bacterium]
MEQEKPVRRKRIDGQTKRDGAGNKKRRNYPVGKSWGKEMNGIGTENESSLHAALKNWYARPGDEFEAKVDGYIIDIRRGRELIEVQTGNFTAIANKLRKLLKKHRVCLLYPIAEEKWIIRIKENGEFIRRRKSPKKGKPFHLFKELIRIPDLLNEDNFTIEILLIKEEDIWCEDGKGSWRRKGVTVQDRKLLGVTASLKLEKGRDLLGFLPPGLTEPFSNKDLAVQMGEPVREVRKFTYCLRKSGLIKIVGKHGNELLFAVAEEGAGSGGRGRGNQV